MSESIAVRRSRFEHFDPRARLLAALSVTLVIVSLSHIEAQALALLMAMSVAWFSGASQGELGRRLLTAQALVVLLMVTLPFSVPGKTIGQAGDLRLSAEGLTLAVGIFCKTNAILLLLAGLLGSLSPVAMGHALARLGVPDKLVHLLLLTVRYVEVLWREFARGRRALRARAFVPGLNRHTWRTLGWLIGMLLVRGAERGERVAAAMRCRGFTGRLYLLDELHWRPVDTWLCLTTLALALVLAAVEFKP